MANNNDFKTVNSISMRFANLLGEPKFIGNREVSKARLGFYLLGLECITQVKELNELLDMIIDTEFQSVMNNVANNDLGIDAVYIDHEERVINLFNFKYRENFHEDKGQKLNEAIDCSKFLMHVSNESTEGVDSLTKEKILQIVECNNSSDTWQMKLYLISNNNVPIDTSNNTLQNFMNTFGMEIIPITLDDLSAFLCDRPLDLSAKFVVDNTSVMTYEIDEFSSSKSYLVKLPLIELIRITCNNEEIRNNVNDDLVDQYDMKLDLSFLYENVRGYLGQKTKFNKNIIKTIVDNPTHFFMFNNGVTVTANNVIAGMKNGGKKFECEMKGIQIVNGGQTLRTIYEFWDASQRKIDPDEENINMHLSAIEKLQAAEILVRIFQTKEDETLTNYIAEYTNSQNAVSSIDLKSIHSVQVKLEVFLDGHKIQYVRKSGDVGTKNTEYEYRISMDRVAQIIYSYLGNPEKATNQKSKLFESRYSEVFENDNVDFDKILDLINLYRSIEEQNTYKELDLGGTGQKCLYIVYLKELKMREKEIKECIQWFESQVEAFEGDKTISNARKLIRNDFRTYVDENVTLLK